MSGKVVSIRRYQDGLEDLNDKNLDDRGQLRDDVNIDPDLNDIKALLRRWTLERRGEAMRLVFLNVKLWAVILMVCLIIAFMPFPRKVMALRWVIPMVIAVVSPLVAYALHCLELEKQLFTAFGTNDLQNIAFNYVSGGFFLAEIPSHDGPVPDPRIAATSRNASLSDRLAEARVQEETRRLQRAGLKRGKLIGFIGYRVLVNEEEKANSATIAVPSGTGPSPNTLGNSLAEIRFLYVVPEYRRRAVGSLLLATAYEHASQLGYAAFSLQTHMSSSAAMAFFKSQSFRLVESRFNWLSSFGALLTLERPIIPRGSMLPTSTMNQTNGTKKKKRNGVVFNDLSDHSDNEDDYSDYDAEGEEEKMVKSKLTPLPYVPMTQRMNSAAMSVGDDEEEEVEERTGRPPRQRGIKNGSTLQRDDGDDSDPGNVTVRRSRGHMLVHRAVGTATAGRPKSIAAIDFRASVAAQAQREAGVGSRYVEKKREDMELTDEQLELFLKGFVSSSHGSPSTSHSGIK